MTPRTLTSLILIGLIGAGCRPGAAPSPATRPVVAPGLPDARHGQRAHLVGDRIIMMGGFEAGSDSPDRGAGQTWVLDISTGSWKRGADMPSDRAFFGSVMIGNRIYAIGGGMDAYDPATDRWETLVSDEAFPKSHFGAAAVDGRIYALGGFPARSGGCIGYDVARGHIFDPSEPPGFAEGDHFHIMANLAGELHIVGGLHHASFSPTTQHWVLRGDTWQAAAPPPMPLWLKFSIVQEVGDRLFVFEGDRGLQYDAGTDQWAQLPGLGLILVMPATIALDRHIVVLGGLMVDGGPSAAIRRFSLRNHAWLPEEK